MQGKQEVLGGLVGLLAKVGIGPDTDVGTLPSDILILVGALAIQGHQLVEADDTISALAVESILLDSELFLERGIYEKTYAEHGVLSRTLADSEQKRTEAEEKVADLENKLGELLIKAQDIADDACSLSDDVERAVFDNNGNGSTCDESAPVSGVRKVTERSVPDGYARKIPIPIH